MSTTILTTKLHIPTLRPQIVARPRLLKQLDAASSSRLILISAPAGFGKTTLVSQWIAASDRPVAWLSLDEGDNDLARFLAYVLAALQTVDPQLGEGLPELLQSPASPDLESILTILLNQLAATPTPFTLVLDDYHLVDEAAIDNALAFLLQRLPPQMQLLIATREDPQLPLPRLRVRGQLSELRVQDLRFSHAEAAGFLREVMGLQLSEADIAALEKRTEGWIAGLQLAALSMRGRDDVSSFIQAFAGDHRFVLDYLAGEVLQRQSGPLRRFLLQTAILQRLTGPLCDAVTGQKDGGATLEALERGNLFVVSLDDRRQWYRYHHLFADVLLALLKSEQPLVLPALHRRAGEWYEQNGDTPGAVHHAFAAEDFEWAARLLELAWAGMDRSRQSARWLRWVQRLPAALLRARPVLCVGCAWAHLDAGDLEAAESYLRHAQRWLDNAAAGQPPEGMVVADQEEFLALPATIATARAYLAQARGDVSAAMSHARHALQSLPQGDHLRRGIAGSLLGLSLWTRGELQQAYDTFSEAMAQFERAGNVLFAITGAYVLADIRLAQGRLRDAIGVYQQALQLVSGQAGAMRGAAELHLGLCRLYHEQGATAEATAHLIESEQIAEQLPLPRWAYHWALLQARLIQAEGSLDGALEMLDVAQRAYIRGPVPDMRPIAARKARIWAIQGRIDEALAWAERAGLSVADEPGYAREFEYVTLARILLACYRIRDDEGALDAAATLLQRLLQAAEKGERSGSVVEILLLLALVYDAQQQPARALAALERSLLIAEPQGYYQLFVGEGQPLAHLLSAAAAQDGKPAYKQTLLAGIAGASPASAAPRPQPGRQASQSLVEPLSERELEVLELVAQGLSNRQIAGRLYLALSTVKGHNRNIYAKLRVRRRTEAIARARQLGLL